MNQPTHHQIATYLTDYVLSELVKYVMEDTHICICFIAYKVYKELQRIIALHGGINLSVDKVIDIAKTIPTIKLSLPYGDTERVKTLFLTEKHLQIKPLFDIKAILDKKSN